MCGIAGQLSSTAEADNARRAVGNMMDRMVHRGPDDAGLWDQPDAGIVLGHRRLAIIDPAHGRQPMASADGSVVVVFNGAIYNYLELRRELLAKGHPLETYSDTETLLYAYIEWGEQCVQRLLGMFAFAIWDRRQEKLFCARDRLGIKPFYYACDGRTLAFASEIKALFAGGTVSPVSDPAGLQEYLTFQFCLGERTLFEGIKRLEPGHALIARCVGGRVDIALREYWDVRYDIDQEHDGEWFIDNLAALIEDSVRLHLRSDVPLGAHLSGGLDSSAVVCLAARLLSGERLHTFTGAFPEGPAYDETAHARLVASAAQTEYHEMFIDGGAELSQILPRLMYHMDEPVAGPGIIPQYYVSQLAAQHVKVVLGGQGGDELFIGYARYLVAYLERCLAGAIDQSAHEGAYAVSLESIVPNLPTLGTYRPMLQSLFREGLFGPSDERYFRLVDRSEGMAGMFSRDARRTGHSPFDGFRRIFNRADLHSLVNQMTYFDMKASLPALLHVEDRTSMAASIESRVPLLDHRIVELMATVPPNVKFAGGRMKHLFKEAVRNVVPTPIVERKDKMGFPVPLTQWVAGPAREFVREMLLSQRARERGLYEMAAVERALSNEREFGRVVWGLLCLETWHRQFIDGEATASPPA